LNRTRVLALLMIVYGAASLLHFVHNAVYIQEYPNLPTWITPLGVYASWLAIASVGVLGFWLYRRGSHGAGLTVIAVYALIGFGGLDHYMVAPMSAHTVVMNGTIVAEVAAASALLIFLCVLRSRRVDQN
jgi:hypothetical protein